MAFVAEQVLALLLAMSKICLVILGAAFVFVSWDELRAMLPHLSRLKAPGLEIEFSQLEKVLRQQAQSSASPSPNGVVQLTSARAAVARAIKVRAVFEGATILWVDDQPAGNLPFRQLLRTLGAGVEPARSTQEALDLAAMTLKFDLVVSDIARPGENGIDGLHRLRTAGVDCPAVFYVLDVDQDRPIPAEALGITNRPDLLLNLVIDGLERARWSEPAPREAPVTPDSARQPVSDKSQP